MAAGLRQFGGKKHGVLQSENVCSSFCLANSLKDGWTELSLGVVCKSWSVSTRVHIEAIIIDYWCDRKWDFRCMCAADWPAKVLAHGINLLWNFLHQLVVAMIVSNPKFSDIKTSQMQCAIHSQAIDSQSQYIRCNTKKNENWFKTLV